MATIAVHPPKDNHVQLKKPYAKPVLKVLGDLASMAGKGINLAPDRSQGPKHTV